MRGSLYERLMVNERSADIVSGSRAQPFDLGGGRLAAMGHWMHPASQLPGSTEDELKAALAAVDRAGVAESVGGGQCFDERG